MYYKEVIIRWIAYYVINYLKTPDSKILIDKII